MRARHLLAVMSAALILGLAGCGGGGGGGGGGVTVTTDVQGRVVDVAGNGIDGATVQADTGSRAVITATTSGGGYYTLPGIPVQTDFSLTINSGGTILTYYGLQVGAPFNGSSSLDVVFTTNASPPGTTISIIPDDTTIAIGTTPSFGAVIDQGGATANAAWTVSGADGQINGSFFTLSPGPAGTTVKLRAMLRLSSDQVATAERTFTVVNPGGGDDGPPDPPSD